jgi:membrane protease YdiL (CAAX protease family)
MTPPGMAGKRSATERAAAIDPARRVDVPGRRGLPCDADIASEHSASKEWVMKSRQLGWLKRHPVLAGFVLMFAFTWPIDLWAAADSHGWTSVSIPPILPLLVGYGFVAASLVMTGVIDGRAGIRRLLHQFLVWRIGLLWYAVVLLGAPVVDLAAIAVHTGLGGAVPDFTQPFARQVVGSLDLVIALPLFFLFMVLANGEEIGWRGYALPRLQVRHTALVASLVVGTVWAFWHIPKFLTAGSAQDYPFWVFLLDSIAKAILFTWVYNSTGGSLWAVTLLHASVNTSVVFLPIVPAAIDDIRPTLIAIGLRCLLAISVVLVAGPARLTRSRSTQVAAVGAPALAVAQALDDERRRRCAD